MPIPEIACTKCGTRYPSVGVPYICSECGGTYDYVSNFDYDSRKINSTRKDIWRFQSSFGLDPNAPIVTLGEGNTPLVEISDQKREIFFKLEYLNPTGSYKDRGSSVLVSQLVARGVKEAVEDSSGNAGASFAAYAARAGIKTKIFVPESASGPKRTQIEMYGSELVRIPGPRSASAEAVLREANRGVVYASHAYLPFGLSGIATIAYEIFEDLGNAPGTVIAPVGHGGLLLGILRGFAALENAGLINKQPHYIGVQARECSPLIERIHESRGLTGYHGTGETIAEGVKVWAPIRGNVLIDEIEKKGKGEFLAIPEEMLLPSFGELSRMGFYVEPTSALAWSALKMHSGIIAEPIVVILTGSGLKFKET